MAKDYNNLAEQIIAALGGKENIKNCFHCATRLRFQLEDRGKVEEEKLESTEGVLGKRVTAEQYQVIIGPHVADVYKVVCEKLHISLTEEVVETQEVNQKEEKPKATWKKVVNGIVDVISGSFVPVLPVIIAASFIKMLAMIFGPTMLGIISAESDLYILFTFVGDAGFYFLPVFIGYTASKKLGVTPVLGMFMGAIMLHPSLLSIVSEGTAFHVYGIPMKAVNYSSTTIPMILIVWIMSYVEKFFNRFIPKALRYVFAPLCTMLVMLPIALCVVGPLGSMLGGWLTSGLLAISSLGIVARILVMAFGGAIWNVLVLCGMHLAYYMAGVEMFIELGADSMIMPTVVAGTIGIFGMTTGALLRCLKNKEKRNAFFGYWVTHLVGGVTEPALFGIGMRYTRPFIGACLGGAACAIYYAITGVAVTTMAAASNFLIFTQFLGGSTANLVNGIIGAAIGFMVAALYTYLRGFKRQDIEKETD